MATTTNRPYGAGGVQRDRLRLLLRQQEAMLRHRRQILRDGRPAWMSGVMDEEEHSLDAEGRGVGFSVLELTSRTVQGIEAALQRLRALPFAALCFACQQGQDTHGVAPTARGSRGN
jgi:Prokaryotic dksA/traR C4-type zinc finger